MSTTGKKATAFWICAFLLLVISFPIILFSSAVREVRSSFEVAPIDFGFSVCLFFIVHAMYAD